MMMSSSSSLSSLSPVQSSSSSFFAEASSDENNRKKRDEQNDTREGVEGEKLYTIESLRNYAQELVVRNNSYDHRFCFYVAGGGSMAVSLLAATPGASSFLLEGRTTYDRYSFLNSCTMSDQDTKGKQFSYSSQIAATIASNAALKQALKLSSLDDNLHRMPLTIGVGCTSILATTTSSPPKSTGNNDGGRKGKDRGKGGRGNVVATHADGTRLILTIQMKTGRNRFDEDLILSHLVLRSIELLMMYNPLENENKNDDSLTTNNSNNNKEYVTNDGDVVTEQWERPITTLASIMTTSNDASITTITTTTTNNNINTMMSNVDDVVEEAARRVIDGGEDAVVLLPIYGSTTTFNNNDDVVDDDTGNTKLLPIGIQALTQTVIPNKCLIFPGSFNPPHIGHLSLANASIRTLERLEPYIHPRKHNDKPILFELSLTNVDKPSIDPKIVVSRVQKFLELASSSLSSNDNDNDNDNDASTSSSSLSSFPQQWGIVLTRAPLFEEKLKILQSKVLDNVSPSKNINFVIGTDTLVRILNPQYYQDQLRSCMNKSLLELKSNGVGFIVGGRLEQQTNSQPKFVSGRDELLDLPEDVASMFTVMEESEFRVDLSSSEIRKQQQ